MENCIMANEESQCGNVDSASSSNWILSSDSAKSPVVANEEPAKVARRHQASAPLPPCRICGDKASGFHYGANTCEACKGFFRRSILREQNEKDFSYRCLNNFRCHQIAGRLRLCAHCRYHKCLSIGMSKKAIKQGRYTHARRTQYIKEVKHDFFKEEYQFPREPDITSSTIPIDENEAENLIESLVVLHENNFSSCQPDKLDINDNENKSTTVTCISTESEVVRSIVSILDRSIRFMVEFMRCIPDFSRLSRADQSELLKGGHSDFYLLGEINPNIYLETLEYTSNDQPYSLPIQHLYRKTRLQEVYDFLKKGRQLRISKEEITLLRAIVVLSTDRLTLSDPRKVDSMQWYCVNCLRLILQCYPRPNERLWQLFGIITTLRTLSPDY